MLIFFNQNTIIQNNACWSGQGLIYIVFSTMPPSALICAGCGGAAIPGDRSDCRCLFCELPPATLVKTDMRQSIASQNLCDGWAKYRQNAYIS